MKQLLSGYKKALIQKTDEPKDLHELNHNCEFIESDMSGILCKICGEQN